MIHDSSSALSPHPVSRLPDCQEPLDRYVRRPFFAQIAPTGQWLKNLTKQAVHAVLSGK